MTAELTRRDFQKGLFAMGSSLVLPHGASSQSSLGSTFAHPGMLHGAADLSRMQAAVVEKRQPIYAGFERLRDDPHSQWNYVMRGPFAAPGRNPTVHMAEFDSDAAAVYQCALMWAATKEKRYAAISRSILNAWAKTLDTITGVDAILACGLGGFLYLNGAEILRSTGQSTPAEVSAWKQMFLKAYLPVVAEFAPFANGNWDTAALKTVMAIAVFCDSAPLFDHAIQYYLYGCGDGRLSNYVYSSGQCQESGRDQAHTQLGLGHMGDCCEIAWQQGLDLYGALDNRLLKGFEYTAKYQLGEDVPFVPNTDRTGKYPHEVISARHPKIEPVFEQIYNHYEHRMGIPAPNVERAALHIRPEGSDVADHPGFGTFTFSRNKKDGIARSTDIARVFGLRALGTHRSVKLEWLPLHGQSKYRVQRANQLQGPYKIVATDLTEPEWVDLHVTSGTTYFYRVMAKGAGDISLVTSVSAGLPASWVMQSIGTALVAPSVHFNADTVQLEAGGSRTSSDLEGGVLVTRPWGTSTDFTVRLIPRIASQFLSVGIVTENSAGSNRVALYLTPNARGVDEHPTWSVFMRSLSAIDTDNRISKPLEVGSPVLLYGRVMGELWFTMRREGKSIAGLISSDGRTWQEVGSMAKENAEGLSLVGFLLNSGLGSVTTEVVFDRMTLE